MTDNDLRYALARSMVETIGAANEALSELMSNTKPEEELIEFINERFINIYGFGKASCDFLADKLKENNND